jgi:hypothetical protein
LAFIESFREWGIAPRGARSMAEDSLLWPTDIDFAKVAPSEVDAAAARQRSRNAMKKMFSDPAPSGRDPNYTQKASRPTPPQVSVRSENVLTPTSLQMPRFDIWVDADKQAATFHSWLLDEDWKWMADALGLVVQVGNLPKTISAHSYDHNQANVEIHAVRTAMKRGPLGFPEQHMVVAVTQWRAGFLDKDTQTAKDQQPGAWNDPERDFKYRAGCTLLIDPQEMLIRRVIRTPGTVDNDDELDRMRHYLLNGLSPPDAFAPVAARFSASAEPFALLHSHGGD